MALERACPVAEIPEDEGVAVRIGAYDVVVCRDGPDVYALQDRCSHQAVLLSEGEVEGCEVECYLHGSRFDLRTGKPTGPPATEPVTTFPIEIRDEGGTAVAYVDTSTTLNDVVPT